jgi:hypothetical protein
MTTALAKNRRKRKILRDCERGSWVAGGFSSDGRLAAPPPMADAARPKISSDIDDSPGYLAIVQNASSLLN